MTTQETRELRELLYYGMDNITFRVGGETFQISAGWEKTIHSITVYRAPSDKQDAPDEIFATEGFSPEENIKRFFDSPIFAGKTFWEVEQEIEWVDD